MSTFFEDTMTGLLQAVSIEKGNIPVEKVANMPAETYRITKDASPKYNIIFSSNTPKATALK